MLELLHQRRGEEWRKMQSGKNDISVGGGVVSEGQEKGKGEIHGNLSVFWITHDLEMNQGKKLPQNHSQSTQGNSNWNAN